MAELQLYNSLSKKIEPFKPHEPGKVRIYHCGPTVYKRQHIGNMRRFLFADFLRRTLEFLGYEVLEVTNITDVGHLTQDDIDAGEDKIAKEAQSQKTTPQTIAELETERFFADLALLNIQPSQKYPRATQHIQEMQDLITKLLEKEHAYATKTGVYYDITTFPNYGKLSGNTLEDIEAGKRIAVREEKKHPADFALWIFDDKALQRWDSPWGVGYPGWHIECSAMSLTYLGSDIDIHTGGEDNRFPHHENEIAQSEGATDQPFVHYWMHNRHLQLGGKKLAKREGQQVTLDTIIEKGFSPLAFRLHIFGTTYRSKTDFSWEALAAAQENLDTIKSLLRRLCAFKANDESAQLNSSTMTAFTEALDNDLNTPQALAVFLGYVRQANNILSAEKVPSEQVEVIWTTLRAMDHVVGVIEPLLKELDNEVAPENIRKLAKKREEARQNRDFAAADQLRVEIEQAGYVVEDTSSGPRVYKP